MHWTQERLGAIRAYVFAAVAIVIVVLYFFRR
jgi:hypothetical protein